MLTNSLHDFNHDQAFQSSCLAELGIALTNYSRSVSHIFCQKLKKGRHPTWIIVTLCSSNNKSGSWHILLLSGKPLIWPMAKASRCGLEVEGSFVEFSLMAQRSTCMTIAGDRFCTNFTLSVHIFRSLHLRLGFRLCIKDSSHIWKMMPVWGCHKPAFILMASNSSETLQRRGEKCLWLFQIYDTFLMSSCV